MLSLSTHTLETDENDSRRSTPSGRFGFSEAETPLALHLQATPFSLEAAIFACFVSVGSWYLLDPFGIFWFLVVFFMFSCWFGFATMWFLCYFSDGRALEALPHKSADCPRPGYRRPPSNSEEISCSHEWNTSSSRSTITWMPPRHLPYRRRE